MKRISKPLLCVQMFIKSAHLKKLKIEHKNNAKISVFALKS